MNLIKSSDIDNSISLYWVPLFARCFTRQWGSKYACPQWVYALLGKDIHEQVNIMHFKEYRIWVCQGDSQEWQLGNLLHVGVQRLWVYIHLHAIHIPWLPRSRWPLSQSPGSKRSMEESIQGRFLGARQGSIVYHIISVPIGYSLVTWPKPTARKIGKCCPVCPGRGGNRFWQTAKRVCHIKDLPNISL